MDLHYLVQKPKEINENHKAIVLIHGYGSNEEDLFSFAPYLDTNAYIFSLQAPYSLHDFGYAWYSIYFDADENKFSDDAQAKESVDKIAEFIKYISDNYPINTNTICLIGFSQGAILSYSIAFNHPKLINKVIALSGYFNEKLLPATIDFDLVKNVKFFASHGNVDQVIPVEWARKTEPFFKKNNLAITYKEYPSGHGVIQQNFIDFKNWMES